MNKAEFVLALNQRLDFLPAEEASERVEFYVEMIDDRMEKGLSEEAAVLEAGGIDDIVSQIIADVPLTRIAKKKVRTGRRLSGWEIILLILGSPVWLSLLISVWAVVFSLYVSLWAVVISLWAGFVSVAACGFAGIAAGGVFAAVSNVPTGVAIIASGMVCLGLSIFFFFGCKVVTKGLLFLTRKIILVMKNRLVKGEKRNEQ